MGRDGVLVSILRRGPDGRVRRVAVAGDEPTATAAEVTRVHTLVAQRLAELKPVVAACAGLSADDKSAWARLVSDIGVYLLDPPDPSGFRLPSQLAKGNDYAALLGQEGYWIKALTAAGCTAPRPKETRPPYRPPSDPTANVLDTFLGSGNLGNLALVVGLAWLASKGAFR